MSWFSAASDAIEDGVTWLVYRSGEPTMLARQLRRLLDGPALHHRFLPSSASCALNCAISSSRAAHNTQPGEEAATRT